METRTAPPRIVTFYTATDWSYRRRNAEVHVPIAHAEALCHYMSLFGSHPFGWATPGQF